MFPVSFIRGRKVDADPAIPHILPDPGPGLSIGNTVVTEETYNQIDSPGTVDGLLVSAVDHTHGTPPPGVVVLEWLLGTSMPPGVYPPGTMVITVGFPFPTTRTVTVSVTAGSPTMVAEAPSAFSLADIGATYPAVAGVPAGSIVGVPDPGRATASSPATATATGVVLPLTIPGKYKDFGENGGARAYYYDPSPTNPGFPVGPTGWRLLSPYSHEVAVQGTDVSVPSGAAPVPLGGSVGFSTTPVDCNVRITVGGTITQPSIATTSVATTILNQTTYAAPHTAVGSPLRVVQTTFLPGEISKYVEFTTSQFVPRETALIYDLQAQGVGAAPGHNWISDSAIRAAGTPTGLNGSGKGWRWNFLIT